jgi:L-ectoine synthase
MIVKSVNDLLDTDRDVRGATYASRRFLLAQDGVGFTLTETTIDAGVEQVMWYKHHIEANYIIEGEGEVENISTGEIFPIKPGTVYVLDKHEKHRLVSFTRLRIVCVFLPALTGRETHDADGSYAPAVTRN